LGEVDDFTGRQSVNVSPLRRSFGY